MIDSANSKVMLHASKYRGKEIMRRNAREVRKEDLCEVYLVGEDRIIQAFHLANRLFGWKLCNVCRPSRLGHYGFHHPTQKYQIEPKLQVDRTRYRALVALGAYPSGT
jgi:hypothetical protein